MRRVSRLGLTVIVDRDVVGSGVQCMARELCKRTAVGSYFQTKVT